MKSGLSLSNVVFFPPPVSDLAENGLRIQLERRRGEVKPRRGSASGAPTTEMDGK